MMINAKLLIVYKGNSHKPHWQIRKRLPQVTTKKKQQLYIHQFPYSLPEMIFIYHFCVPNMNNDNLYN